MPEGSQFAWSDEQQHAAPPQSGGNAFAWSDEKDTPASSGPVTLNAKRGGSSVTQPDVKAAAIDSRAKAISDKAARSLGFMAGGGLSNVAEEASGIIPAVSAGAGKLLKHGQYEAPESPIPQPKRLGEGVIEGEYLDDAPPAPSVRPSAGALPRGTYHQRGGFEPTQPALPARGTAIPLPESFNASSRPVIRTTPSEPLSPLTTRGPEPIPQPVPHSEYPPVNAPRPVRLTPEPGSPEDIAETKDIQHQMKDAAEAEDRNRLLAVQRDRFPQRTKFDLTNEPVKFTKTPGVSRPDGVKPGTVVPAAEQNLTGLLRKSLAAAKKAKK